MGRAGGEGRISELGRNVPQNLVMGDVCEFKKAVAATKEVTRPFCGEGREDCSVHLDRLHHTHEALFCTIPLVTYVRRDRS